MNKLYHSAPFSQGAAADAPLPPVCTAPPPGAECGPFVDATCAAIFSEPRQGVDNTAGYLASLLAQIAYDNMADNRRVARPAGGAGE